MKKILASLLLLFTSASAFAHVPYVQTHDSHNVRVPDPMEKSMAFYATFESRNDVDLYSFRLDDDDFDSSLTLTGLGDEVFNLLVTDANGVTGRKLHLGTLVPGCAAYEDILPMVAVVGPLQENLPAYDGSVELPFEVDEDEGVYLMNNETQGDLWYEKFTFKTYFDQEKSDIVLSEKGKYKVYVWEPSGNTGDYVLEMGYVEVFGFAEIMRSIVWLEHLANDGEIGCRECREQLQVVDREFNPEAHGNPTLCELIKFYKKIFIE